MIARPLHLLLSAAVCAAVPGAPGFLVRTAVAAGTPVPTVAPAGVSTAKAWTRWWWPGSGVDKASITQQMEQLAAAGIGGVEITPIYGAKGAEDRYIEFLSPKFMEMLEHVGREGRRLGLGIDMATGTGWPFGGPWVTEADAMTRVALQEGKLGGELTRMMVKRAAPGGEGLVVNPYSPAALRRYFEPFDAAFANFPHGLVRGQFHDSFEYYFASWAPELPEVFREMHGYDLQEHAAVLMGTATAPDADTFARIRGDFRATLSKMHLDYLRAWVEWSHARGFVVRNQSHGAPGNLLDLYANADIPETETFGSTPFPIPGLRRLDDEVRHGQDLPEPLVIRFASSAAHVTGNNLSSSETCTWLRDHWKVSLAYTKPEIDRLFVNGINHIFYHGTVYSPQDAPWPGWLFYASTQFNPSNTWWQDFGALNRYVERVQTVLQGGTPDHDVLLYWPEQDVWETYDHWQDNSRVMQQLTVHHTGWATSTPFGRLAASLAAQGYGFDYISDRQLQQVRADSGRLVTPGGRYRALVVPATARMPLATMQKLVELARANSVLVFEALPQDVPGYGRLAPRREEFQKQLAQLRSLANGKPTILHLGNGRLEFGDEFAPFSSAGVRREEIAEHGIGVIRRATTYGYDYFLSNLTNARFDRWVRLGIALRSATIEDPLTGRLGFASVRRGTAGRSEIFLQLAPGESLLVHTLSGTGSSGQPWGYLRSMGEGTALDGTWQIEFIAGGPEKPAALTTTELKSWTELGDAEAQRFGGTARYRIEFDKPATAADEWMLDLGDVRESARVRLNGREVTTAWSLPFRVRVGEFLQNGKNVLELEVTNLAANRIRDMDRRGVHWKIMHEINFVDIRYQPFDASGWALKESGLLGPVRLIPMRMVMP